MNTQENLNMTNQQLYERTIRMICGCQNMGQVQTAENYALLAGLRFNLHVIEALKTMKEIFNIYRQ
jgi:hypothetical protein